MSTNPRVERISPDLWRWQYKYNLFRHFGIFVTVFKAFSFSFLLVVLFLLALEIGDGNFFEALKSILPGMLMVYAVICVITFISYAIWAMMMGGYYHVEFEMTDKGISHTQIAKQFKKAKRAGNVIAFLGLLTGKPGVAGAGLMSANRSSLYSEFVNIRRIIANKRTSVLKLHGRLKRNEIYLPSEDFDDVLNYIIAHCPNAKIKGV